MNIRKLPFAAALLASASSFAAGPLCTGNFSLDTMGPPATKSFGNGFNGGTLFSDCYDFSINAPASTSGTTAEVHASFWFLPRYIDVLTVSLYNSAGSMMFSPDATPNQFSFGSMAAGSYTLVVGGYASLGFGTASYTGTLTTTASTMASPVPEAPLSGMIAMAMIGAALVTGRARRR